MIFIIVFSECLLEYLQDWFRVTIGCIPYLKNGKVESTKCILENCSF